MAYTRGRFGVEYQPNGTSETHHLRWLVAVVALLVLVAFVAYRFTNRKKNSEFGIRKSELPSGSVSYQVQNHTPVNGSLNGTAREGTGGTKSTPASHNPRPRGQSPSPVNGSLNGAAREGVGSTKSTPASCPLPRGQSPNRVNDTIGKDSKNNSESRISTSEPTTNPEAKRVEKWLETAQTRPDKERVLLERLAEAERRKNVPVAIDTIKKLCDRPTMADLQDTLLRRLGDLNLQHLLSGVTTPWTAVVKVRRGDSRDRIARENRTTTAAITKLNPNIKWDKLQPGDSVRVLNFPNAVLVVYKQRGYADLSLKNGQFFRRYYLTISKSAKSAVYPVAAESGSTAHSRLRELGIKASPTDRVEIEMFLAPGSRITVAE